MSNRILIIGDVHGCLVELQQLLDKVQYTTDDKVILLGDYVDRGPFPLETIRLIQSLCKDGAVAIQGNHDEKHVRYRKHEKTRMETGRKNPIHYTPERHYEHWMFTDDDIAWLKSLPKHLSICDGRTTCVHGGLNPFLWPHIAKDCQFLRYIDSYGTPKSLGPNFEIPSDTRFWAQYWKETDGRVFYGHAVHSLESPYICNNTYGLDTGCVFGGRLTCAIIRPEQFSLTFAQVNAIKKYAEQKVKELV